MPPKSKNANESISTVPKCGHKQKEDQLPTTFQLLLYQPVAARRKKVCLSLLHQQRLILLPKHSYKKKEQDHVINVLLRDDGVVPLLEGDDEQPANVSLVPLLEDDDYQGKWYSDKFCHFWYTY